MAKFSADIVKEILDIVAEGYSLLQARAQYEDLHKDEGLKAPNYRYLYKLIRDYDLEEYYFNACQTRKAYLSDKILEDIDAIEDTVAAEFYDGKPVKYINNTAAIAKLDLKRKVYAGINGRIEKHRMFKGEDLHTQLSSLIDSIQLRMVSTAEGKDITGIFGQRLEFQKADHVQQQLAELTDVVKKLAEAKGR